MVRQLLVALGLVSITALVHASGTAYLVRRLGDHRSRSGPEGSAKVACPAARKRRAKSATKCPGLRPALTSNAKWQVGAVVEIALTVGIRANAKGPILSPARLPFRDSGKCGPRGPGEENVYDNSAVRGKQNRVPWSRSIRRAQTAYDSCRRARSELTR